MNINITKILDPGIVDKERLVMKVVSSDDIGRYIVFDTVETGPSTFSSRPKNVYWFPDGEVSAGDLVVLYSKKGNSTKQKNPDGTTTYFFYWGKQTSLWNNSEDGAALLRIENVDFKPRRKSN